MQNNDFHCFEWLCIVFVWFAWFWLICIVFYDLHGFHTCSWYFNYFLIFYWEIMQILCATLTIVFFLSTITPTLKLHIWVQTWPGLTCGDLRGPAGTCGDRSRPAGIGAHFGQNLIWIFTFVPTPTSILVSCAFAPKVWNHHSHNKKNRFSLECHEHNTFPPCSLLSLNNHCPTLQNSELQWQTLLFLQPTNKIKKWQHLMIFWGFLVRRHAFMCKVMKKQWIAMIGNTLVTTKIKTQTYHTQSTQSVKRHGLRLGKYTVFRKVINSFFFLIFLCFK